MIDVEPPYRSGDSDKVKRDPKWPSVEGAKRRIEARIDGEATNEVALNASDLLVLMRELGRVTAECNHLKYERQEIIDNALEEQAALAVEPASGALPRQPTEAMLNAVRDWSIKKYGQGIGNDGAIGCWQAMYDAAIRAQIKP